jgi:hypothetical protein
MNPLKEAIRTLTKDSFIPEVDENGHKYYRLNYDLEMPKIDSFSEMHDWHWFARMYEVEDSQFCPVKSMGVYRIASFPFIPKCKQRSIQTFLTNEEGIFASMTLDLINFVKSSEEIILFIVTFGRFLSSIFISSSKTLLELNAICLRIEMRHDSGSEFIYRLMLRVGDGFLHNCACFLLAS